MLYRNLFFAGKQKALTLSYDDGVGQDLRLMEILRRYDFCATFNVNGGLMTGETHVSPQGSLAGRLAVQDVTEKYAGFELALHGYVHIPLASATPDRLTHDIVMDRIALEPLVKRPILGMAYANGSFDARVIEQLRAMNIRYARTTLATHAFRLPEDFLAWHPTCHHNDAKLFDLADEFLASKREQALFYLWGHSYEFDTNDNWDRIESFCEKMRGQSDVWYATNGEIYDYVRAQRALESSCDGKYLHNPSAIPVWIEVDRKAVEIGAGECKAL